MGDAFDMRIEIERLRCELDAALARAEAAEREVAAWKRATGFTDADAMDFDLGRMTVSEHCALAHSRAEKAERDLAEARAKANEAPGLSAALDEARWERDVVLAREPAAGQALAEIERLVRDLAEAREVAVRNATDCAHLRQSAIALEAALAEARKERDARPAITPEDALLVAGGREHTGGNGLSFDGDRAAWEAFDRVDHALRAHAERAKGGG